MSGVLQYIIILLYSFERRVLASCWEILEALLILSKMLWLESQNGEVVGSILQYSGLLTQA